MNHDTTIRAPEERIDRIASIAAVGLCVWNTINVMKHQAACLRCWWEVTMNDLAAYSGVSKRTCERAVKQLTGEGLLSVKPGVGRRPAAYSMSDYQAGKLLINLSLVGLVYHCQDGTFNHVWVVAADQFGRACRIEVTRANAEKLGLLT